MPTIAVLGGTAAVSSYLNYRAAKKAGTRTPGEEAALGSQTGIANDLRGQSNSLFKMGMPALAQGSKYFSTLASGDRSQMTQALAPEIEQTNQVYGGTRRNLARFLRGPDRDYQMGELERQRAGSVASLFRDGRTNAVSRLLDFGTTTTGNAQAGLSGSAGIFAGVGKTQQNDRLVGADIQRQAGADTGQLLSQLLAIYASSRGGRGGRGGASTGRG